MRRAVQTPLSILPLALICLVLIAIVPSATAQTVPDFASISGHEFGQRITVHAEMTRYLEALDEASPRVAVIDQGASWEGRHFLLAVVTSPENHARIDEIRAAIGKLGDPRGVANEELLRIASEEPAIVWLGGSIHGFELSGSEGLLKLLEHLTTQNDEATRTVLDNAVVLIDPMINPDGRDAFAGFNHSRLGHAPNPRRDDWGNDTTRWQGLRFRTGHYFFDTNRDWFAHTQRESLHRAATIRKWRPQVVIDAHEMGPDNEFYFDPPTDPHAAHFPPFARQWFERFGRAYADAFDANGFEYTQNEIFNFYYPGYTTSWGSYQGAVGMLYEQGSSRGLALERGDRSVRTLADALEQQYTAAWTAVSLAAQERQTLLEEYATAHLAAIDGAEGPRRYLLAGDEGNPRLLTELVDLLRRNGIEVSRLDEAVELDDARRIGGGEPRRNFPAGSFIVETSQPRSLLIRTLLDDDLEVPEDFLTAARARLDRGENAHFYDITAWSLPLLFNLGAYASDEAKALSTSPVTAPLAEVVPSAPAEARYAYLIDGRAATSLSVLHHLRRRGFRAAVTREPMRIAGEDVPSGTVVVRTAQDNANGESVHEAVRELAARFKVEARAVDTGRGEAGAGLPALGSTEIMSVRPTEVAILAEQPVHGYSFGWAWYVLDRQYEIPTTVLRVDSVASTPLEGYQTLIIPDLFAADQLAAALGENGQDRLKRFVQDGGTLVALGAAVDFVVEHLELTALRSWYGVHASGEGEAKQEPRRFRVPGAFFEAEIDPKAWLSAGYSGSAMPFLINSDRLYLPADAPPNGGRQVAVRVTDDARPIAGHAWDESLERLPGAVLAYDERIGRGRVIAFPEDLNFRGYWRGVDRLFLNAVLLGPSAP